MHSHHTIHVTCCCNSAVTPLLLKHHRCCNTAASAAPAACASPGSYAPPPRPSPRQRRSTARRGRLGASSRRRVRRRQMAARPSWRKVASHQIGSPTQSSLPTHMVKMHSEVERRPNASRLRRWQTCRLLGALGAGAGGRARSHCRFAPPLIHFIPDLLPYSVPLFAEATMRPHPSRRGPRRRRGGGGR